MRKSMVERITVPDAPHDGIVDEAQHLVSVPLSDMNVAVIDLTNGMEQDVNVGGTSIADLAGYDAANTVLAVGSKGSNGLSFLKIGPVGLDSAGRHGPHGQHAARDTSAGPGPF